MSLVVNAEDEYTEILSELLPQIVECLMIILKDDLNFLLYTFGCLIKTCKSFYERLYTERYSRSITRLWNKITCPSLLFGKFDRSNFVFGKFDRSNFDHIICSMYMNRGFLSNQEHLHPFTFVKNEQGDFNRLRLRDLRTPARFFIIFKYTWSIKSSVFFDYIRDIDYNLNILNELGRPCATVHIVFKVNISNYNFKLESLTELKSGQVILSLHICGNARSRVNIPDNLQGWERSHLSISKCSLSISDNAQFHCHTFIMINLPNWMELSKLKINAEVIRFIDLHILEDLNLSRMDWTCKDGLIRFRNRANWRRIVKNPSLIYQKKNFDLQIHKK